MEKLERKSKLVSVEEAAALVKDGMTIYIGGFTTSSHPMAIVRQIIKNGVKDLTVVGAATSCMEVDLMIAANCVKKVVAPYVGIEGHMSVAPFFQAYAQDNMIDIWEVDESMHYSALKAAANELPFWPDKSAVGTDYCKLNPAYKLFLDPIDGEELIAVPPVTPDISFIYAAESDVFGNIRIFGSGFGDRTASRAATMTVVQAEKIIANEYIRMQPERTTIHGVDMVVRAPYGAHPFSSPGLYVADDAFLEEYCKAGKAYLASRDRAPIEAFIKKYVMEPESHLDYLDVITAKRLCSLYEF